LERASKVLARRRGRAKVFLTSDGLVYKLLGSALHWSIRGPVRRARRFELNTRRLAKLGIACPRVVELLHVAGEPRDVVVYEPLTGESMRDALSDARDPAPLRQRLAGFKAHLHRLGIYFAAGHLGNYIVRPDGTLGLIDVHDLWISYVRLGALHRARAFHILMKYADDRALLGGGEHIEKFVNDYLDASGMGAFERNLFLWAFPARSTTRESPLAGSS
jgi:hypothetical protein